jgi:quercetin dioxygenase-like cupin family protein
MVFTDYAPRSESPLHNTLSVDYAVVISGRICLELEGGEEVRMGPGEVLVQAGAMHKWKNETDEWTRVLFVMLGAHSDEKED